jgi:hypothetical protein
VGGAHVDLDSAEIRGDQSRVTFFRPVGRDEAVVWEPSRTRTAKGDCRGATTRAIEFPALGRLRRYAAGRARRPTVECYAEIILRCRAVRPRISRASVRFSREGTEKLVLASRFHPGEN